ncbi:MAG: Ca-activated chloride channel family protein, partial [Vicingaceae bacterium]
DLEILTLPRTNITGVNIVQSRTTTVEIPQAGLLSVGMSSKGYGGIFQLKGEEMVWVCNISSTSTRESIVLQPGNYRLVFRPINSRLSIYTKEESFEIQSGQSTQVKL